ncbi:MAG: prepilin-type N-terminal cleavage/methylation domain-containing protein [Chitinispirillaceae bacterium]|nr:prepilin-type N-terminal cleavage/methylation domain-containing protein [Chitinispirillaceae bacterium]
MSRSSAIRKRMAGRRRPAATGFTLIESVMALSLLAIISGMAYSFYLFAHKQVLVRERKAFAFESAVTLIESIAKNIRSSRGTVMLDETQWVFLKPGGDTASYFLKDGALWYNNLVLSPEENPIAGFTFDCRGSDSLLDIDADNNVSFRELDLDASGAIEGSETRAIAWIQATIVLKKDPEQALTVVESVKNAVQGEDGEGFETFF